MRPNKDIKFILNLHLCIKIKGHHDYVRIEYRLYNEVMNKGKVIYIIINKSKIKGVRRLSTMNRS